LPSEVAQLFLSCQNENRNGFQSSWLHSKSEFKNDKKWAKLSFKSLEQRFYMEEDMKGKGREKCPLSFNIIAAQEI